MCDRRLLFICAFVYFLLLRRLFVTLLRVHIIMYSFWVFVVRIELDNKLARVLYMLVARALITVPIHVERGVLILQQQLADLIVSITPSTYTRIGSLCVGVNNDDGDYTAFCLLGSSHRIMIY